MQLVIAIERLCRGVHSNRAISEPIWTDTDLPEHKRQVHCEVLLKPCSSGRRGSAVLQAGRNHGISAPRDYLIILPTPWSLSLASYHDTKPIIIASSLLQDPSGRVWRTIATAWRMDDRWNHHHRLLGFSLFPEEDALFLFHYHTLLFQ